MGHRGARAIPPVSLELTRRKAFHCGCEKGGMITGVLLDLLPHSRGRPSLYCQRFAFVCLLFVRYNGCSPYNRPGACFAEGVLDRWPDGAVLFILISASANLTPLLAVSLGLRSLLIRPCNVGRWAGCLCLPTLVGVAANCIRQQRQRTYEQPASPRVCRLVSSGK